LTIVLNEQGMTPLAGVGGRCEELVKAGHRVLAIDVRGLGETAPAPPSAKPGHFGNTWRESFLSLHLNRPLLGQRVYDLLSVIEFIEQKVGKHLSGIELIGTGNCGPIALHAAALEPRIKKVTLEQPLVSWSAVTRLPLNYDQMANAVPNALSAYDLPDLAALIAPRPLTLLAPVDPARKPATEKEVEVAWKAARAIYEEKKAGGQLSIKP
jgi:cephalosporin-C deacetylase-like acetyl esterase